MTLLATSQTWMPTGDGIPASRPGDIDSVQKHALGTRMKFRDANYGEAEFIYLLGVASTVAGDPVTWLGSTHATTRAVAGAGVPMNVGFASAATVASTWGWYQITGLAIANKTKTVSLAAGVGVGISTTALVALSSSLKELQGARVAVVASATTTTNNGGKVVLNVYYPHLQGRIT